MVGVALDNHDLAAMDSQAHGELLQAAGDRPVTLLDGVQDGETGTCRALGVVVVRLGPAEVGHDPIAEELRDVAAEAYHLEADGSLIVGYELAPFLGIHATGNLGRIHEIGKEHGQMASFSLDRGGAADRARRGKNSFNPGAAILAEGFSCGIFVAARLATAGQRRPAVATEALAMGDF